MYLEPEYTVSLRKLTSSVSFFEPYLAVYDAEGAEYSDSEYLEKFDAEIISWQLPTPIENTFEFIGFSYLYELSMFVMLLVAVLTIAFNIPVIGQSMLQLIDTSSNPRV